jgi:hypothetical protein
MPGYCDICETMVDYDLETDTIIGCICSNRNEAYYKSVCIICNKFLRDYRCIYYGHPPTNGYQPCSGWIPNRTKYVPCSECKPSYAVLQISKWWKTVLFKRFFKRCILKKRIRDEISIHPIIGEAYLEGLQRFHSAKI